MIINKIIADRYLILEKIGKGGNSRVYKSRDLKTGEIIALKQFHTHNRNNKDELMFSLEREIDVLKHREHPSLPKVYNILHCNKEFYIVMEYVDGVTLTEYRQNHKYLSKKKIKDILLKILSVTYYLHSLDHPVIYRDFKPDNIMVKSDGNIKLIDFGSSKKFSRDVSMGELGIGSPKYAAPEQFGDSKGQNIYNTDIRTDIYGVGGILYFLMTGVAPGNRISYVRTIALKFLYGRRLFKVAKKALSVYPKDRYANDIKMIIKVYES